MHEEIMIKDQRAKVAVIWTMVNSGFIDTCSVDKNTGDNYVVISLWLVTFPCCTLCHGSYEPCIQRTVKKDRTTSLSPRCAVLDQYLHKVFSLDLHVY